ncbi:MBL fold metallo-hydrolase [bacterium]|nr:MAG: MBL fold metallo-hydrolase [bacterium]
MIAAKSQGAKLIGLSVLASGSKGNSIYLEGPDGALLIDAGLSAREIVKRIESTGADPGMVRGILLTHEHSDHMRGVKVVARRLKIPVYATPKTVAASRIPEDVQIHEIKAGSPFTAAGFEIMPFTVPHDALDPVGFIAGLDSVRIGVATDLGHATTLVRERLKDCRAMVLESNHDEKMLMEGPYPWFLKQRVKSRSGHLSNTASSQILGQLTNPELQFVVLAHLSEINNEPDLALGTAREALAGYGSSLRVASASVPTKLVYLDR